MKIYNLEKDVGSPRQQRTNEKYWEKKGYLCPWLSFPWNAFISHFLSAEFYTAMTINFFNFNPPPTPMLHYPSTHLKNEEVWEITWVIHYNLNKYVETVKSWVYVYRCLDWKSQFGILSFSKCNKWHWHLEKN